MKSLASIPFLSLMKCKEFHIIHRRAKCSKPRARARSKTGLNVEAYCWLLKMTLGLALGGIKAAAETATSLGCLETRSEVKKRRSEIRSGYAKDENEPVIDVTTTPNLAGRKLRQSCPNLTKYRNSCNDNFTS